MAGIATPVDRVVRRINGAMLAGRRLRALVGLLVLVMLAGGGSVVYAMGGTQRVWPHLLYVPVLLAAWGFGPLGGALTGLVAGLVLGPLMPLDTGNAIPQELLNWTSRLGFFVLIGGLAGGLNQLLRAQVSAAQGLRDRFAALVEHAPDLILLCNTEGCVRYASPSLLAMLGHEPASVDGVRFADLVHVHERHEAEAMVGSGRRRSSRAELRVRHADGSWRHLELVASPLPDAADVGSVVLNARDVTPRRAMEAELRHQAWHDPDTGLANRQRLTEVLREALPEDAAVLLIGLQRFREISETLGQGTSDQIITALAQRLERLMRPDDLLARYETSEFAILCRGMPDLEDVRHLAGRLLRACDEPFLLVSGEVHLQASIGIAIAEDTDPDPLQLLHDAYAALWNTRPSGTERIQLFQPAWREQAAAALTTESALHGALERGELELHYQPIVNLRTRRAVGAEALLRWHHPRLGLVPPSDFIPIAEQSGLIIPIGRWVLQEACAQLTAWRRDLVAPDLHIAVNLSARQLDTADLADHVRDALRQAELPPDALTLELTETTLFDNTEHTVQALIALHGLGVRLAIDDFGTGYSSLGYLKRLPVDVLKIDRMFISQLDRDHDDAIVSAIIGLARSLGMDAVAEGVEEAEQARHLIGLGCEHAQGYHFARPQPAGHATVLLAELLGSTASGRR
jgi:diguanylate cyclase (GGDEF)-like protein/PAS domain S-box-containing protein